MASMRDMLNISVQSDLAKYVVVDDTVAMVSGPDSIKFYKFSYSSTTTEDGENVIKTNKNIGRWLKVPHSQIQADYAQSSLSALDYIKNKPTLFDGNYNSLTNKPTIPTIPSNISAFMNDEGYMTSVAWTDLENRPTFAEVATTGSYSSLLDRPSIPTVPTIVSAFTNDAGYITSILWSAISGKPTFAIVATSGSYNDLSNKPSIPVIPTSLSSFANDVGFITGLTWAGVTGKPTFHLVATSGAYADLSGRPTLSTVAGTGAYSDLTGKPTLSAVATSGAYTDLSGRPSLAAVATSGSYTDLSSKPTIPPAITFSTIGTSGVATFNAGTGALNIPNYATPSTPTFNNNVSRSLSNAAGSTNRFTISTTQNTRVYYSLNVAWSITALLSTSSTILLEYSTDSGSSWIIVNQVSKNVNLGLLQSGNDDLNVSGEIPANALVRIRPSVSTNATITYIRGQEILY